MAKRKKYPKLPNGFGSIKYLSGNRRNHYAVHPPVTEFKLNGSPKTPKAICYVDDWMIGFAVLTAFHAGKYYPGYERTLENDANPAGSDLLRVILADYNSTKATAGKVNSVRKTFADVFHEFYHWKYEADQSRKYSRSAMGSTNAAFKNCKQLHDLPFVDLRYPDLQGVVDACPLKHSSKELIVSLFHQMYAYAEIYEITDKDYSVHVKIREAEDDEHGTPFTDEEISLLWQNKDDEVVEMILIMVYSGFRILEFVEIEVDLEQGCFRGGVKTRAGRNRTVPIHSAIYQLVTDRHRRYPKNLLGASTGLFRKRMYAALGHLGILESKEGTKHTPHDCRHTFSALCERYGVRENDRKRMLGHSFNGDITNEVYGHRTVDDLRAEIEKIQMP